VRVLDTSGCVLPQMKSRPREELRTALTRLDPFYGTSRRDHPKPFAAGSEVVHD
jgi:hypothetical protein